MKTLLITGTSGFLGGNLLAMAARRWKIYAAQHHATVDPGDATVVESFDVTDRAHVERLIRKIVPDVIIHAAAMANANLCADHGERALEVNVQGTENVAAAAEMVNARLIYVSTDLVFDGERGRYTEEDPASPVCHYGRTKLEGERRALALCSNCCVLRSALLYGWSRHTSRCFTEAMIADLEKGKPVGLFTDEYRTPLYVRNLGSILLELAQRSELQGLFHAGTADRVSRFQFGVKLCEVFGFSPELLVEASYKDFPFKEKRPGDCSLQTDKLRRTLTTPILSLDDGLRQMRNDRTTDSTGP